MSVVTTVDCREHLNNTTEVEEEQNGVRSGNGLTAMGIGFGS
jgi:hypothetical protein